MSDIELTNDTLASSLLAGSGLEVVDLVSVERESGTVHLPARDEIVESAGEAKQVGG